MFTNYVGLLILVTTNITAHDVRQRSLPHRTRTRIRHNATPSDDTTQRTINDNPPPRFQGFPPSHTYPNPNIHRPKAKSPQNPSEQRYALPDTKCYILPHKKQNAEISAKHQNVLYPNTNPRNPHHTTLAPFNATPSPSSY